jgi:hypothetical protein
MKTYTLYTLFGIICLSVAGCYVEPIQYVPLYPYGYAYRHPYVTIRPNASRSDGYRQEFPAPDDYEQRDVPEPNTYGSQNFAPPDPDDVGSPLDQRAEGPLEQEDVIGGDEPHTERSSRNVRPWPRVTRHRDHSGDFRPW